MDETDAPLDRPPSTDPNAPPYIDLVYQPADDEAFVTVRCALPRDVDLIDPKDLWHRYLNPAVYAIQHRMRERKVKAGGK